jgi:teichuronic acid biosynthesis glycosyltransferase TuaG
MIVSIIIPYFKKKKYIQNTLNSIYQQTFKNYEIIIIYDDESLDELKFLNKITKNKKNVKIIKNRKNIGAGFSRNKGIKKSRGKYIAFIDADDLWDKNKLKFQIKTMESKKLDFSHTSYEIINEDGSKENIFKIKKRLNYNDLMRSCDIGLSTVMISKKILDNNKFNNFKTKEDYSLWLKLSKKEVFIFGIAKKLTKWRKVNNSLSDNIFQKILDAFKVYYFEQEKGFFTSLFFVFRLSLYAIRKKL